MEGAAICCATGETEPVLVHRLTGRLPTESRPDLFATVTTIV